jgi:hypothetical protein
MTDDNRKHSAGLLMEQIKTRLAISNNRLLKILAATFVLFGIMVEALILYGQTKEAAIKKEIARNAEVLAKARAEKTAADAVKADALAKNAQIRQEAEKRYKSQQAIVETAIAKYAERMKRAEADKLQAEAASEIEIAKNAEVQLRAEAEYAELEGLKTSAEAAAQQWITNCQAAHGDSPGSLATCSMSWSSNF